MHPRCLILFIILFLIPCATWANPAHCVAATGTRVTNQRVDVYINFESFAYVRDESGTLGGLSQDEVIGGVIQSMEQWNHSAAGIEFVCKGIDDSKRSATCDYAVIRGAARINNAWVPQVGLAALNTSICSGQSFQITVYERQTSSTNLWEWLTGDPVGLTGWPIHDLVGVLTHEFGHSAGIGHYTAAEGVMTNSQKRQLYQLDTECAEVYYGSMGGGRSLNHRNLYLALGNLYDLYLSGGIWAASSGVSGGGGPNWTRYRGARMTPSGLYAEKYDSGIRYLGSKSDYLPQRPTRLFRGLQPSWTREAIVALRRPATNYGMANTERFTYGVFTSYDGFETGHFFQGLLSSCLNVTGAVLAGCSASEVIHSAYPLSFAYDDYIGRSVYVWAALDRANNTVNGDLRIAFGTINSSPTTTGPSFSLGARSDSAPAIACKAFQAGIHDCLVAYTDVADPVNSVRFKRLHASLSGNHFVPSLESSYQQVSSSGWQRTASPLGLVYHEGKWRLSMKLALATGGGGIRVYSSPTGTTGTWTLDGQFSYTVSGGGGTANSTGENSLYFAN